MSLNERLISYLNNYYYLKELIEIRNSEISKIKTLINNRDKCVTQLKTMEQQLFDAKFEGKEENVNKLQYLKLIKKLNRLNMEIMDNLVDSYFF